MEPNSTEPFAFLNLWNEGEFSFQHIFFNSDIAFFHFRYIGGVKTILLLLYASYKV